MGEKGESGSSGTLGPRGPEVRKHFFTSKNLKYISRALGFCFLFPSRQAVEFALSV